LSSYLIIFLISSLSRISFFYPDRFRWWSCKRLHLFGSLIALLPRFYRWRHGDEVVRLYGDGAAADVSKGLPSLLVVVWPYRSRRTIIIAGLVLVMEHLLTKRCAGFETEDVAIGVVIGDVGDGFTDGLVGAIFPTRPSGGIDDIINTTRKMIYCNI
jgi:hypothetical protein